MTLWQWTGFGLAIVAAIGFIVVAILYELEPIKSDSFGAFQSRTMPWIAGFCIGLGLILGNAGIAAIVFFIALFGAGPLVHWIASLFRESR